MIFVPSFWHYVKVDEGREGEINSQHILEEENRLLNIINLNILNNIEFYAEISYISTAGVGGRWYLPCVHLDYYYLPL